MFIRVVNTMLGFWLFVSAFLLPHSSRASFHNTWIVGFIVTGLGIASILGVSWARRANFVLALWLFLSAFLLPRSAGPAIFHHVIIAVLLVVTSLFPERERVHQDVRHPA
jgi:hypothetical protein